MESVLRDRHRRRAGTRARRASSCARCAAWSRQTAAATGWRSAPPARTRSRAGRTSGSSSRPRYRDLIAALRFVARQELIFGMHVHVGMDDPDKAIHVANGMRVHVPLLLALSANSPFWRGDADRPASTRMPIFRAFPRVGIPPRYDDWEDFERRIELHGRDAGVIEDYTYLWYDVRPHPNFGTVEIRAMDSQTRVEHTLALAALIQAMVKELAEHFEAGKQLSRYPYEMLDENKWLAARHGLEGELVDLPERRARARHGARRGGCSTACARTPRSSARPRSSTASRTCSSNGNGAARQRVVYEANHDLRELVARDRGRATVPEAAPQTPGAAGQPRPAYPRVTCRAAGPVRRLQELRVGGQPVRHRVPVLRAAGAKAGAEDRARGRAEPQPRRRRAAGPRCRACAPEEIAGIAPDTRPYATFALIGISLLRDRSWSTARRGSLPTWADSVVPCTRRSGAGSPPLRARQPGLPFVTLVAVGIFGTLLERRFGPLVPWSLIFVLGGRRRAARWRCCDVAAAVHRTNVFYVSAPTAPRSACSAPGWWTTGGRPPRRRSRQRPVGVAT